MFLVCFLLFGNETHYLAKNMTYTGRLCASYAKELLFQYTQSLPCFLPTLLSQEQTDKSGYFLKVFTYDLVLCNSGFPLSRIQISLYYSIRYFYMNLVWRKLHERFQGFKSTIETLQNHANKVWTAVLIDRNPKHQHWALKWSWKKPELERLHCKSLNNIAQENTDLTNDSCALCSHSVK